MCSCKTSRSTNRCDCKKYHLRYTNSSSCIDYEKISMHGDEIYMQEDFYYDSDFEDI